MKRLIAVITSLLLVMPVFVYAGERCVMADGAITLDVTDDWSCYENNTQYYDDDQGYSANYIFTASKGDTRLKMFCMIDDEQYMEDPRDYTYEEQKDMYIDTGRSILKHFLSDYLGRKDYELQVIGNIKSNQTEYLKIKGKFEDEASRDIYVYFAESYEGLYEIYILSGTDQYMDIVSESDREDAEKIVSSIVNDGLDSEIYSVYDDFGEEDEDAVTYYSDDDDYFLAFVFIGVALLGIIGAAVQVSQKEKQEESGIANLASEIAAKVKKSFEEENEEESSEEEKASSVSLNESIYDGEISEAEPVYRSSASYEKSLKDMLDSGLITKKEYRELLKKHGK